MATAPEYTTEQLNYYRICYVATDILPEGLRSIFKQEWDNRYTASMGEWVDEPRNGMDFYNAETPRNQRRNAHLLRTMTNGDRSEWDCTMLFYAILFSDCIGPTLNPVVQSNVDDLRRFRNEEFAHISRGQLSDRDFQSAMGKVHNAFQGLSLSTVQIQDVANQTTFPTEELIDILNKVEDLKKELQEKEKQQQGLKDQLTENEEQLKNLAHQLQEKAEEQQSLADQLQENKQQRKSLQHQLLQKEENQQGLEDQLKKNEEQRKSLEDQLEKNEDQRQSLVYQLQQREEQLQVLDDQLQNDTPSFCILPPRPSHDIAGRSCEVAEITQQLKELKQADEKTLSHLYISGNPGSGKSQLAGLVAKQFFDNAQKAPNANVFVMTLNAESLDTLLESYFSFARHLKCSEYAVTNIFKSKDLKTDEKIIHLKTLISAKVTCYSSWLLIADNVKSISQVLIHLPGPGNEQWARGQLLITSQDTASIPIPSSFIGHISVKKGMKADDACALLAHLSGIAAYDMEKEVAKALDYQPLALASAATYVKQLRLSKTSNFGWNQYLEKVGKGQRLTTETILAETNPSYPKSMTEATTLAVNEIVQSNKVIDHTFRFLSLCAPDLLSQDIVINYILNVDEEIQDKEMIIMRIQRCSLILLEEEDGDIYIGLHQVVRDVIQSLMKEYPKNVHREAVSGAITAFGQFIDDSLPENQWLDIDTVAQTKRVAPHLKCLIIKAETIVSKENIPRISKTGTEMLKLGQTCEHHCDFNSARKYYEYSLETFLEMHGPDDVAVGTTCIHLGSAYQKLDDFNQAKEFYHRALNIKLRKLGPEHVEVATIYSNLGSVYHKLDDFEQAREFHHRALSIKLKKLGLEDVEVATIYGNLGSVYQKLDDFEQAKGFFHLALSIKQKKLGPGHVEVATIYSSLGIVYMRLGDFEQAKEFHHRALNIKLKKLGAEHVEVATIYNNLGSVCQNLGDLKQAKEFHHRALDIKLKKLGPEHGKVATIYGNLGFVYRTLGDFEQAKNFHHRALNIKLKKLGPEHVEVGTIYGYLGSVYQKLDDFEQAKEFHHRALNIKLKKLGPEHVEVATIYDNLGSVYRNLDTFEQAKEFHHRALNIKLKRFGAEHVEVATIYDNLGSVHQKLEDFEQAKEFHHRALNIKLKKLGLEHVEVATIYDNLGSVYQKLDDFEQAKDFHHRALNIKLKKLGPQHVEVATVYDNLGSVYQKLEDFEQAKKFHHRASIIRRKKLRSVHLEVSNPLENIVTVERTSVELPTFSESNNPSGVMEQKQHRRVRSKRCRIL